MELTAKHGDCADQVADWYRVIRRSDWRNLAEVRQSFRHADSVGDTTVFNIKGNETIGDALTDLVETYEEAHVVIPARTGVDALRFLMEANDLKQVDLVPVLGRKSLVSEVLGGKRPLALTYIKKLADYFRVSPAVFID